MVRGNGLGKYKYEIVKKNGLDLIEKQLNKMQNGNLTLT